MTLRVVELFAGVGSQRMALKAEGIPHEVVAIAEIDRHALASYEAIHGDCPNLGDITKVERLPECDLVTYSFPCQDLSLAGKRAGMGEGTRSGLVWEVVRLLEAAEHRPEWLLMENVPQVLTSPLWPDLLDRLVAMGYRNKHAKLDSSRFGSAQKRVRAFMVSRLDSEPPDLPTSTDAPSRCIRDIMEPEVSERYVRRIPLERIKWREPRAGTGESSTPIAEDTYYSYQVHRKLWDAEGKCPTIINGHQSRIKVVADWQRDGIDMANRLYDPDAASPSVVTHGGGDHHVKVADHVEPYNPDADIHVFGCRDDEGNIDQSIDPCKTFRNRRLYIDDGKAPACTLHTKEIPVADRIEPTIKVVAEDTYRAYGASAKILSPDSSSPTLRSQAHGLQNQPKVADHVEPMYSDANIGQCTKEDLIAEHFAKARGPGDIVKHDLDPFEEGSKRSERGLYSVQMEDGHLRFYSGGPGGYGYQDMQYWSIESPSPAVTAAHAPKVLMTDHVEDRSELVPRMEEGDVAPMLTPGRKVKRQNGQRFREPNSFAFTVTCQDHNGCAYPQGGDLVVRVLTPRECWRLMGFSDEDYDKAATVSSETQLYNQAGNSIVVEVLRAIFHSTFVEPKRSQRTLTEAWA